MKLILSYKLSHIYESELNMFKYVSYSQQAHDNPFFFLHITCTKQKIHSYCKSFRSNMNEHCVNNILHSFLHEKM